MKNKRILKSILLILLGLIIIALYLYDKRGGFTTKSPSDTTTTVPIEVKTEKSAPLEAPKSGSAGTANGGIPSPKPNQ